MKNNYDKIFLAVALLIFIASLGFFLMQNSSVSDFKSSASSALSAGAKGETWEDKSVAFTLSESMDWQYPKVQDANGDWLFQVFTPPKIWLDKDGKFITTAPKSTLASANVKFEIAFDKVTSALYDLKMVGYIGSSTDPIFQFQNKAKNLEFTGKKGVAISIKDPTDVSGRNMIDLGLKVLDFKKERITHADNTISDVMIVTLEDKNVEGQIELRSDKETYLPNERRIQLVSSKDPETTWLIKQVGEKIEYDGSIYTVTELSFDDAYVVVEQTAADLETPVTIRLGTPEVQE